MSDDNNETKKPTISQYFGLWGYQLFCGILHITDVRLVALFGRIVGYITWALFPGRRRIVARNLRIVIDPMLRKDKLKSQVRRNMVRTSMNLVCALKTGLMRDKEAARAINMVGVELFKENGMNGHCVIAAVPHAGNWEILARIRPHFKEVEHFGSMYRRLTNPLLEKLVYKSRTRYGCEMFSKEEGLRSVLKLARSGGLLGVLSDQYTQEGLFLPYFGKMTGTTPLPALLYKRCKGKGHLFSVYTRNTALGKWDAVLNKQIELPEGCDSLAAITMEVNKALEECQRENILDGFWMHHRWKSTSRFAPIQDEEVLEVAKKNTRLPYRIMVMLPEQFEEAVLTIPELRILKERRFDIELTLLCRTEQQAFWKTQPYITHVVPTDTKESVIDLLEEDEIYKGGPFDMLIVHSEDKKTYKALQCMQPFQTRGPVSNKLYKVKKFNSHKKLDQFMGQGHRVNDHLAFIEKDIYMPTETWQYADASLGNQSNTGTYIAPFSTLGKADSWPESHWKELVGKLPERPTLLALEKDADAAQQLAGQLGIQALCVRPEHVAKHLGPNTRLIAVDGLLPQLAALCGCPCTVIMASRTPERYAPLGEGHRALHHHTPCHPCHRTECDMEQPCTAGISADDVLATT